MLSFTLLVIVAFLAVPALIVSGECLLALLPANRSRRNLPPRDSWTAVLIPAHNEEQSIGPALESLRPQLQSRDRILVVADHCTDATIDFARARGAAVLERAEESPRGKGHALNAGIELLRDDPPDVVVIMDADCVMEQGSLDMLVAMAGQTSKPAQARYVMHSSKELGILGQISAFAFLVRNVVRPLGLSRIGQPCHLMGTGMAFPWAVVETNSVPKDHLVEDLQMGIDLLRQGHGPQFCNSAQVTSQFPPSRDASREQYKRWTHGHLQTILHEALPLLVRAVRRKRADMVLTALDLAVPPLSLLVMLVVVALTSMALVYQIGGPVLPFLLLTVVSFVLFSTILVAWSAYGRDTIPLGALLLAPLYAVIKVPTFLDFITNPEKTWQGRSERDSDRPVDGC